MSISRWMDKKIVVHLHNGIVLSYKKEYIWVSSNEVNETGAFTLDEWSKPKKETQIQYINAYIWNLKRQEQQPYMQDSKRDTDVKNRHLDSVGEGEGGTIWENSIERYVLPYVKWMTSASSMHEAGHSKLVLWDSPEGWGGKEVGGRYRMVGHMYIHDRFRLMYEKTTIIL